MKTNKLEIQNYKNFVGAEHFDPILTVVINGKDIKVSGLGDGDIELSGIYTRYGYLIDCRNGYPTAFGETARAKATLAAMKARNSLTEVGEQAAAVEPAEIQPPTAAVAKQKVPSLADALSSAVVSTEEKEDGKKKEEGCATKYTIHGKIAERPLQRYVASLGRDARVEVATVEELITVLERHLGCVATISIIIGEDADDGDGDDDIDDEDGEEDGDNEEDDDDDDDDE